MTAPVSARDLHLDLKPLRGRIPYRISKVLPDPTRSHNALLRYLGEDLSTMSQGERDRERWRLQSAVGHIPEEDLDRIPTWIFARITLLRQTLTVRGRK